MDGSSEDPTVRSGPAVAGDFVDDVVLALRQIVRILEVLDVFRTVGADDPQLVPAGGHLLRFTSEVASPAFEPPKHDLPLSLIRQSG